MEVFFDFTAENEKGAEKNYPLEFRKVSGKVEKKKSLGAGRRSIYERKNS